MLLSPPRFCVCSLLLGSVSLSPSFSVSSGEQVFIQFQSRPPPHYSPRTQIPTAPAIHLSPCPLLRQLLLITHPEGILPPASTYSYCIELLNTCDPPPPPTQIFTHPPSVPIHTSYIALRTGLPRPCRCSFGPSSIAPPPPTAPCLWSCSPPAKPRASLGMPR